MIIYENGNMCIIQLEDYTYRTLRNGQSIGHFVTLQEAKQCLEQTISLNGNYDEPTQIVV